MPDLLKKGRVIKWIGILDSVQLETLQANDFTCPLPEFPTCKNYWSTLQGYTGQNSFKDALGLRDGGEENHKSTQMEIILHGAFYSEVMGFLF